MVLSKQESLEGYAQFLRGNGKELDALYSDVLISVTSFFRNPEAFETLSRKVFSTLMQRRGDEPFRVWVLGCSTGQEAYSIAMAFIESAEKAPRMPKLQVFATDLNDALLEKARHGLYARSLAQDVSPERLRRFFVEEEGGYRIVKSLREMVVFARQNFISDPPFSRIDLVSCRNLMIYLEPSLQRKLLPAFHYALKPEGFLFLGASESIGDFNDLFEPVDKKTEIYARKAAPTPALHLPARKNHNETIGEAKSRSSARERDMARRQDEPQAFRSELNSQREADRVTINRYSPAGVLVNAEMQILQFRGTTSPYLEPPTGKASFDLLKMARQGLMLPLRAVINKVRKEDKTVRRENVRVEQDGDARVVNIEVIPLRNLRERSYLVLFEEADKFARLAEAPPQSPSNAKAVRAASAKETSRRSSEIERELVEMRDYVQSVLEQQAATNEELQASNEEVQSANEELQSINEELETSKEELESANEELTTVNEEMSNRNAEVTRANSDLVNLQTSTKLPILWLGRDLTIRRFSAQAERQFNLVATDIGRPVGRIRHNLDLADLEKILEDVILNVREDEREVRDQDGRWFSLRMRPYLTIDNKVDGAVLVLVSINELKRVELAIAESRDYATAIIRNVPDPLVVLTDDLRIQDANNAFYNIFHLSSAEADGRSIFELDQGAWNISKLRQLLEETIPQNSFFNDFEVTHEFERLGRRTMLLNGRRLMRAGAKANLILLGIKDVTESLEFQADLRRSHAELREHEGRQQLLMDELNHRVKNTLATVQAIASQSLKGDSNAALRAAFDSRLIALSRTHDLLARDSWEGASLSVLLLQEFAPYRSDDADRFTIEGPELELNPKAALALGLAFHELTTNAVKYGALSNATGQVRVVWDVVRTSEPNVLRLKWTELGGPQVKKPGRKGFGSIVTERGLSLELEGEVRVEFELSGLVFTVEMPLAAVGKDAPHV